MSGVLITGGARRLGAWLAEDLALAGYDLVIHYEKSHLEAEELAAYLSSRYQVKCAILQARLTGDEQESAELIKKARALCPDLEILINNASNFSPGKISATTEELFDLCFNSNFKAAFFLTKSFTSLVDKGVIINILDCYIHSSITAYSAYLLSKKALGNFTSMAAREFGPNFRVNAIAPGLILPNGSTDEELFKRVCPTIPLQRQGNEKAIGKGVKFLIECDYITGQTITIDGGRSLI
ncbi:MAG: SDR family oxidoreductase [Lentisphaeria bacterium]